MNIGQKIKKVRELRNYTQEFLASELGFAQETYSKIESGRTKVSIQRLELIANILKVNINDLLNFDDNYVFHNSFHHQQHSKNIFGTPNSENEFHEKIMEQMKNEIETLKSEITFLRSILKDKLT